MMRDRTIAVAADIVNSVSKALEARDAGAVFADRSRITSFLDACTVANGNGGIEADIQEGRPWEALRKLVGCCYVETPARLRPDQQALLTYLANVEARPAAAVA